MPTAPAHRILVADDQPDVIEGVAAPAKAEGYATEAAKSPAAVIKAVEANDYALVLMDLNYARDTRADRKGSSSCKKSRPSTPRCPWWS